MKKSGLLGAVCACLIATSFDSLASIITIHDATYDSIGVAQDGFNITRDIDNGLEWFDFSLTLGRSYNDILGDLGSGGLLEGWRFATSAEFLALGNSAGVQSIFIDNANSNTVASVELIFLANSLGLNGRSDQSSFGVFLGGTRLGGITLDRSNGAIFDAPNDPGIWLNQNWSPDRADGTIGGALVRDVSTVPIPAAAWLFGSGLMGLVSFGRRKQNVVISNTQR